MLPQVGQAILDTHMSPMQQVKAKLGNSKAFQSPSDNYTGYTQGHGSPGGIPKEVLQAAAMSGGGNGRRNIKIRAVQKGNDIASTHDVGNNDMMNALNN